MARPAPPPTRTTGQDTSLQFAPETTLYWPLYGKGRDSQDVSEDGEAGEVGNAAGDDDGRERLLDVGVLLQAMGKCNEFYLETDMTQFYAMVAEEYGTMLPECQDIPVETIEKNELILRRIALSLLNQSETAEDLLACAQHVKPHVRELRSLYKSFTDMASNDSLSDVHPSDNSPAEPSTPNLPESPHNSVHSATGHTDGSASNPTTPVVDDQGEDSVLIDKTVERTVVCAKVVEAEEKTESGIVVPHSGTGTGNLSLSVPQHNRLGDRELMGVLADLTSRKDESSQRLRQVEERVAAERALVAQRKQEYKALKVIVKEYRQRDKEKKRLAVVMMEGEQKDDGEDFESDRSLDEDRKALRKEIKRYKRLQETLSLQFKLLESEAKRHEMKIEQELAELKPPEPLDYLFPDIASP